MEPSCGSVRLLNFFRGLPIAQHRTKNEFFQKLLKRSQERPRPGVFAKAPPTFDELEANYTRCVANARAIPMLLSSLRYELDAQANLMVMLHVRNSWERAATRFATRIQRAVLTWLYRPGPGGAPAPICARSLRELEIRS